MNANWVKLFKLLIIFIISTVLMYLVATVIAFYSWGTENQMFINSDNFLDQVDKHRIDEIGEFVSFFSDAIKEDMELRKYLFYSVTMLIQ